MAREKQNLYELHIPLGDGDSDSDLRAGNGLKTGTSEDVQDMHRLGLKQELKRNFNAFSILGFTSVLMGTWEAMISSSSFSLINGGLAGTIWVYVASFFCTLTVSASLADMASMAPTSGGQYHWVSEFAPKSTQRFLSYIVGWLSALGWQAAIATTAFSAGVLTLDLASVVNPSYTPTQWQGTLMTIAIGVLATLMNTVGAKRLPLLEGIILFLHVFGFFAILVPLWVLAPKAPAREVFGSFSNFGGWPTLGTAIMVGQLTATGSLGGSDAGAHMAEEVRNASLIVPRVIMSTILLNGVLGFVMIVSFVFCITDLQAMILESTLTFPFIGVFYAATGSRAGAIGMTAILIVLTFCTCLSVLAAASRQVFAFARDGGVPYSGWFRKIANVGTPIPLNAVVFSLAITVILSLINLGSTTAFNSIVGLLAGSGGVSYAISIGCVLLKRLRGEALPVGRWSLGKLGIPVNAFAMLYMIFTSIISFFPLFAQVTVPTMNWGSVVFSGVTAIALVLYFVRGRKNYRGPVVNVNRE